MTRDESRAEVARTRRAQGLKPKLDRDTTERVAAAIGCRLALRERRRKAAA